MKMTTNTKVRAHTRNYGAAYMGQEYCVARPHKRADDKYYESLEDEE